MKIVTNTIERARRYVAKIAPAISGAGGHNTTFHVAVVLVNGFALNESDALALLIEWNRGCQPPWSESDLVHKITSAAGHREPRGFLLGKNTAGDFGESPKSTGRLPVLPRAGKPVFKPETLKRVAGKAAHIKDVVRFIADRSPVRVESQDSASVLRRLYRRGSGEKVVLFNVMKSSGQFLWEADQSDVIQNHHLPKGPEGVWFLPQPVDGERHPNTRQGGKLSRRSEESITAWRYAVLESDKADADAWLRCLIQMPLRIASICESGGRSIHALVRVDAASKVDWDARIGAIKPLVITLGADRGALTAVRLSRLPQARRGERVQRLLYLNPEPDGVPILRQPPQVALYGRKSSEKSANQSRRHRRAGTSIVTGAIVRSLPPLRPGRGGALCGGCGL